MILLSGGIFSMSSWIGINNDLQRLSKMGRLGRFCCRWLVLLVGPTEFITNIIINAVRLTTKTPADEPVYELPARRRQLTRNWTVFYWLWWISYTPGVAMFVTASPAGAKSKR